MVLHQGKCLFAVALLNLVLRSEALAASPASLNFPNPSGYSTATFQAGGQSATGVANVVGNQALAVDAASATKKFSSLWSIIGPVSTGPYTTTVSPTPEPSVFPAPDPSYHPLVPSYIANLSDVAVPDNFLWGLCSSAYQIEGATHDEGKGATIWDLLSHRVAGYVADGSTSDVTALEYYLYKQDIARLKALGVQSYSFSISWARIFPLGNGPVNPAGVAHYDDLIATLVAAGIKPIVTLYHFDAPLNLFYKYGAWVSEDIVNDFFNYAKYVIERYDAYVPIWYTINEPQNCNWFFSPLPAGEFYPNFGNYTTMQREYQCGHYTLLAHAKTAKWYHERFLGRGLITFKNSGAYFGPNSTSPADIASVKRNYDFGLGWFNNGPWNNGDYPDSMKATLGSILPTFTAAQKKMIKGSCDFFAIDGYQSYNSFGVPEGIEACQSNPSDPNWPGCAGSSTLAPNGFPIGPAADPGASWLYSSPTGIRKLLSDITKTLYPSIPNIVVSEFGFAEPFESRFTTAQNVLWDLRRSDYLQSYLDNILAAIHEDGVNVTGAFAWAIMDNLEGSSGLTTHFGMQWVERPSLERYPKASMFQFLDWFKAHGGVFS